MNELRVKTADGKYEVIIDGKGHSHALRHGEPWAAYPEHGSIGNLALSLARDLSEARERIAQLEANSASDQQRLFHYERAMTGRLPQDIAG